MAAIAKKRTDFEQRVNASDCRVADFARYTQYEMNVEALYRKRSKRLKGRAARKMHFGQRRIIFLLDRATRRFPGDLALWLQYIEYAKSQEAHSVLGRVLTAALRLHPAKPQIWIYAARHSLETELGISEARGYMHRGLRFCSKSKELWIEYAKLEMVVLAKVSLRRAVLGIDKPAVAAKKDGGARDEDEDMIALPNVSDEDSGTAKKEGGEEGGALDTMALKDLDTNPAFNGEVEIAIFDRAMKEIPGDVGFADAFYDLFAQFAQVQCCGRLLQHVVTHMLAMAPSHPRALWLGLQLPLRGVATTDPVFPRRLATVLSDVSTALDKTDSKSDLHLYFARYFAAVWRNAPHLDPGIRRILAAGLARGFKRAEREDSATPELYALWANFMANREMDGLQICVRGLDKFPGDAGLLAVQQELRGA